MEVTKIREVLAKAANERKAVKRDKGSGVAEFRDIMDNYRKSNEDEVKPKEPTQDKEKSESNSAIKETLENNDNKSKVSKTIEDNDGTEDNIATPPMIQSIIMEIAQVFNLENTQESTSQEMTQVDSQASEITIKSAAEGVSKLLNLFNFVSTQANNGQTVSKEVVEGKLNELGDKLQGLISAKSFENIKQQLLDVAQGKKTSEVGNVKAELANIEAIIRNELAQLLNKGKVSDSNSKKPELKISDQFTTVDPNLHLKQETVKKDNSPLDNLNLKVELKEKFLEGQTTLNQQTAFSSDDKAEKLLKSLLTPDKSKGQKENANVNDKLFNFLTQFDSVNNVNGSKVQEGITVNKNTFSQDIIKAVKFMENSEIKDLTVKIAPKELGEVIIKLTMDKGVMKASLSASNKEAYSILNSNLSELNNKLSQSDIKIQEFSINIYNGDTTFFSEEFNRQNQQQHERRNGLKVSGINNDNALDTNENEAPDTSNVNILA